MADTSAHKRGFKLKQFNDQWYAEHEGSARGLSNLWEKDLRAAGMRPDEIVDVFPRGYGKQRKLAGKEYRAKVKNALRTGREIPLWREVFDYWRWD